MYDVEVSIVVITYNHGKFISQALDSILMQNVNFTYEIVIGDDCSPDNTQEILKQYKEKYPNIINLILRDKNIGAPANIYDVYLNCKGKYIAILEGDDLWINENKLQIQTDFLNNNPSISSVAHRTETVDQNRIHMGYNQCDLELDRFFNKAEAFKYRTRLLHPSSLMFRNFILGSNDKYEIIRDSNKYGIHALMILLLASKSDIYIFSQAMSAWRCIIEEKGTNYSSMEHHNPYEAQHNVFIMYKNFRNYFKDQYNFDKIIILQFILCSKLILKSSKYKTKKIIELFKLLTIKERFKMPFYLIKDIIISIFIKTKSLIKKVKTSC